MPPKRKTPTSAKGETEALEAKKQKLESSYKKKEKNSVTADDPLREPHPFSAEAEENGIVLRKFYPHEMPNARALAYNNNELPRPIEVLVKAMEDTAGTRKKTQVKDAVVHWFKMDLRTHDNRALWMASQKAREAGVPLVCMYIVSPQDFEAHLRAPIRIDFMFRTLHVLKADLAKLGIPLYVETVGKRKEIPTRIIELLEEWGASHLFANMEYEVDELRREANLVRMCAERGIAMEVVHDTCVVPPGALMTGAGKQYSVYTPWYKSWVPHVQANPELLDLFDPPEPNPESAREKVAALFNCEIPEVPENKRLSEKDAKRFRALYPAGEHEAMDRLEKFAQEKIASYHAKRNFPAQPGTSNISVHLAAGTLSSRTAIRYARDRNTTKKLNEGIEGIKVWISEVAWRDFYKHVLVHWPYVWYVNMLPILHAPRLEASTLTYTHLRSMNKPFKPEYSNIIWSYNAEHFEAWRTGRTGYPIVDAAMRQVQHMGWMHNRLRMVVASFLCKDLLLDWRMGERFFMENLVDGDFASNNGGWGFSASVGVDPQPYFRVFNPILQSEKFDPEGDFIRKYLPELRDVKGKAIHDPYGRGAGVLAKKAGYLQMIVDHKAARQKAIDTYKEGIKRETT
ncbi:Deoxyribodipyrimidine photo-lyase [Apiospora rasikravindrae]|uniref:Deoxyribodipyrimidine photo-lyase n=1 Tax=Apiospora rasikravindrae TaxID=990691 RepID=A0ABR1SK97_9PEZI